MSDRKYIIISRKDIDNKSESWISQANLIMIEDHYLTFFPTEGENSGKKHYIPFSNIHIVREL